MPTTLTPEQQERVAAALVREHAALGVNIAGARAEVATGKWDDHRAAGRRGRPVVAAPRAHRIRVYLTEEELAALDARRGDTDRSEWLAVRAGLRPSRALPGV